VGTNGKGVLPTWLAGLLPEADEITIHLDDWRLTVTKTSTGLQGKSRTGSQA